MRYEILQKIVLDRGLEYSPPTLSEDNRIYGLWPGKGSSIRQETRDAIVCYNGRKQTVAEFAIPYHAIRYSPLGKVVGAYLATFPRLGIFVWESGQASRHQVPSDVKELTVQDVNRRGQIVGGFITKRHGKEETRAFLFDPVKGFCPLPLSSEGIAQRINSSGTIFGTCPGAEPDQQNGFAYQDGKVYNLFVPGMDISIPEGINNVGQIVGTSAAFKSGKEYSFLWQRGQLQRLDPVGMLLHAINNGGQMVGALRIDRFKTHACLRDQGTIYDLKTVTNTELLLDEAVGINDRGFILAWARNPRPKHNSDTDLVLLRRVS